MRLLCKPVLVFALAVSLVLPVRGEDAKEETFTAENCALTIPADWQRVPELKQPGLFAAFSDTDRNRIVLLLTHERGHPQSEIDDATAADFDKGVEKVGGGTRTGGKFVNVAGFRAYERRGTLETGSKHLSTLMIAVPTGDGFYLLEALTSTGEAADDAQIRQTLGSFRFLHPPESPHSGAYRAGYLMGQFIVFGALAGLVIWLLVKALNRRRSPALSNPAGPYPTPYRTDPPPLPTPPPGPGAPPPKP